MNFQQHVGEGHATSLNAGALKRGFYVFVGLSVLVLAYIVFRSFRYLVFILNFIYLTIDSFNHTCFKVNISIFKLK